MVTGAEEILSRSQYELAALEDVQSKSLLVLPIKTIFANNTIPRYFCSYREIGKYIATSWTQGDTLM